MEVRGATQTRGRFILEGMTVTTTQTLPAEVSVVLCAPSGNVTLTLPANASPWQVVSTKKTTTGTGSMTVKGAGISTIDAVSSFTIASNTRGQLVLVYDGSNWWRLV
jgi:hypothetical protein